MNAARGIKLGWMLALGLAAAGCGEATFECGASSSASRPACTVDTQYCEVSTTAGVTTNACRALPASCPASGSPCDCVSAALPAGATDNSCVSIGLPGGRQTTVAFSR